MKNLKPITICWFRRDLRIVDNTALYYALISGLNVLPIFIFDTEFLKNKPHDDKRISFIYQALKSINKKLISFNSSVRIFYGKPEDVFAELMAEYLIQSVFVNHDYEPYAVSRDLQVEKLLTSKGISFHSYKDHVIFEKSEVVNANGQAFTVFTPYKNRWLEKLKTGSEVLMPVKSEEYLFNLFTSENEEFFNLKEIGFIEIEDIFKPLKLDKQALRLYDKTRDFPALESTSRAGVHLRFGTVSVRELIRTALNLNTTWLNELIWREFFIQILWHFPNVVNESFRPKYRYINWLNDENHFNAWCNGKTGYPLVDAGMRELNATGFMHNRVRMVTASFLTKHLLINWQWGEAYFAEKLLDYDIAANNGNWQWAAGTGCDAVPYFRIFNPYLQAGKYDPENIYIRKWVPEFESVNYLPIINHSEARIRCLTAYKTSIGNI